MTSSIHARLYNEHHEHRQKLDRLKEHFDRKESEVLTFRPTIMGFSEKLTSTLKPTKSMTPMAKQRRDLSLEQREPKQKNPLKKFYPKQRESKIGETQRKSVPGKQQQLSSKWQ